MAIKFLNTVAVDTDVLYVDASSNRVGIGTTSPSQKLDVNGDVGINGYIYHNGDDSRIGFEGNDAIRVYTANSVRMQINSQGDVGIGTTSPATKLHVDGNVLFEESGDHMRLRLVADATDQAIIYFGDHTNNYEGRVAYQNSNDSLYFTTAGAEKMRITSGGNVGIGTTSPDAKLHVNGNIRIPNAGKIVFGTAGSPNDYLELNDITSSGKLLKLVQDGATRFDINGVNGNVYMQGNVGIGTTSPGSRRLNVVTSSSGTDVGIESKILRTSGTNYSFLGFASGSGAAQNIGGFFSATGATTNTALWAYNGEVLLATQSTTDYVGIGTTSPGTKLEVYDGDIKLNDSTRNLLIGEEGSSSYQIKSSGYLIVDATSGIQINKTTSGNVTIGSGNVGIGTTSPQSKLHIYESNSAGIGGELRLDNNGSAVANKTRILFSDSSHRAAIVCETENSPYSGQLQFQTGFGTVSTKMLITGGGNVGIGTTSPTEKLEVSGNILIDSIGQELQFSNHSVGAYRDGSNRLMISGYGGIRFQAEAVGGMENQATRMVINPSGNVGIGTNSPSQKLHVTGNARVTGAYYDSNNLPGTSGQVLSSTATGTDWVSLSEISGVDGTGTTNYVAKWSDSDTITDSVIYDDGTNVGIGTSSPGHKLTVEGNIELGTGGYIYGDTNSPSVRLNSLQGSYLQYGTSSWVSVGYNVVTFRTSSSERMRINSSGNVGIGTTSPNHKVDIYSNENVPLRIHRPSNANLDSSGAWGIGFSTRHDAATSTSDTRAGIFSYYNGNLFLATNNASIVSDPDAYARLTILNGGNVGIGTASPNAKLTIKDSGFGTAYNNYDALYIDNGSVTAGIGNYGNGIGFSRLGSVTYKKAAIIPVQGTSDSDTLGLAFFTSPNSGFADVVEEAMRVNYNGNVGIGDIPSFKLDVNVTSSRARFKATTGNADIELSSIAGHDWLVRSLSDDSFAIYDEDAAAERMRITSTGNFGIGTTSPNFKLQVNGGALAGGVVTYSKNYSSLNTTGNAVAGLTTSLNGASAGFTFTCFGHGGYQKVVYSCYNVSGTWNTKKVIDEGTNAFDVEASANATTITFTFKSRSGTKSYTPRVTVEATGSAINSTYA